MRRKLSFLPVFKKKSRSTEDFPDPLVEIHRINDSMVDIFANIFNTLSNGVHTFVSVSPSLEDITFRAEKNAAEVHWDNDFYEFIERLTARVALTGQAILYLDASHKIETSLSGAAKRPVSLVQGWMINGEAVSPSPISKRNMKAWHKAHYQDTKVSKLRYKTANPV